MAKALIYKGVYASELNKRDQADARRIANLLGESDGPGKQRQVTILVDGEKVSISPDLKRLIAGTLAVAAHGAKTTVTSDKSEIRTQQAADILNVSRQYLVRLCDEGRIPFRWQGSQRRLATSDVLAYKARYDRERKETFRELIELSAETGAYELDTPWPPGN